jgi:diaminohydroxyphosphoribosylaminopyrimidine deaminase/5-amino-6-(5-phosphoribosylamino)uracil reductase
MAHALRLAARAQGNAWPNPAVGCVLVSDGRIVGRGWTAPGGRPHAETQALLQAGPAANGATAYVTLEPCAHHGQTPPCADALISAGVRRVVAATTDPDPRVSGAGFARLRNAGIDVRCGVLEAQAAEGLAGFFRRVVHGLPWLTLKLAVSLDGRIATATGESRWITGPTARRAVHALRASHDAVMVGGGTARSDDPMLTVRGFAVRRQPARVVVSRDLALPRDGKLAQSVAEAPVWLCHGPGAAEAWRAEWRDRGARLFECDLLAGRVDPMAVLKAIGAAGTTRVFCEGGGQLAASLLMADVVDELHVFSAGVTLGAEGQPAVGALGIDSLQAAQRFALCRTTVVGNDVQHVWQRKNCAT